MIHFSLPVEVVEETVSPGSEIRIALIDPTRGTAQTSEITRLLSLNICSERNSMAGFRHVALIGQFPTVGVRHSHAKTGSADGEIRNLALQIY
jgi:hypothetical protein